MLKRFLIIGLLLLTTGCATLQPSSASSCAEESKDQNRLIAWYEKERLEMWYEARELKRDMRALKALLDILIEREQSGDKEAR